MALPASRMEDRLPAFYPTRNNNMHHGLPSAAWFVRRKQQDVGGVFVKNEDGTFSWKKTREDGDTVYEIGRGPYYLSLADARRVIDVEEFGNVVYTDDYNDEYQDYYICNLSTNTPDVPAENAEAIA